MARLPTVLDLGNSETLQGSRPIADANAMPIAVGAEKIGAGAEKLGAGVMAAGAGLDEYNVARQRYEFATASSDFLAKTIALHSTLANDQDYSTLQDRYSDQINDLQKSSADTIGNPNMRSRFMEATKPEIARGTAQIKAQAQNLEGNAAVAHVGAMGDTFIDQATANPDDHSIPGKVNDAFGQQVDGLQGRGFVTAEQALGMKRDFVKRFAITDGLTRSQTDPIGVLNDLRTAPNSPQEIDNRIATVEGTNKNPGSSATGTGQFIDKTWLDLMRQNHPEYADKSDADVLAMRADRGLGMEMLGKLREQNTAILQRNGVDPSAGNIYLAHFLGPTGAVAVAQAAPGAPIFDTLAKSVGPEQAAKMIAANPTVLRGQTSGSVAQWAADRMGGVGPGGPFALLRPDERAMLEQHAQNALHEQTANDLASFHNSVQDDVAQAWQTGFVAQPKNQADFVQRYGVDKGPIEYRSYQGDLQVGQDKQKVATMTEQQQRTLFDSYAPQDNEPGYADKLKRQDLLGKAIDAINKERATDPASFAINRLPGVGDLYQAVQNAPDPASRQQAAKVFATRMTMEQQRLGISDDNQRLVPQGYIDGLTSRLGAPAPKDGVTDIAGILKNEADTWGDAWPQITKQLTKSASDPAVVMASGVTREAGQILNEVANSNVAAILKDENTEKSGNVKRDVLEAFKPFMASMDGDQGAQTAFDRFRGQGEKLAAWYVEHGMTSRDAAAKAFDGVLGFKYDFSSGYRIPKDISATPQQISAGQQEATRKLPEMDLMPAQSRQGNAVGPDYLARETARSYQRDGKWVSVSGDKGLALIYDRTPVLKRDGTPLMLTWDQLQKLGQGAPARASAPFEGVQP